MSFMNKIFSFNPSNSLIHKVRFLFLCWLITLPFGSNLFQFSLGFMTIYPNLVLNIALFPFALTTFKNFNKLEFLMIGFLLTWTITGIVMLGMNGGSKEALFDIRSLMMQFLIGTTLIGISKFIGKQSFVQLLTLGLRCFLVVLLCSGCVEFLTGIHFASYKTTELLELPVGNIFYAPMFVYQNPNDFLVHIIFIFLLLNVFDEKLRNQPVLKALIILIIYIFSVFADSNFAKIICEMIIVVSAFEFFKDQYKKGMSKTVVMPYLCVFVCLIITVFSNPLFIGPKFKDGASYRLNGISIIEENNNQISVLTAKEAFNQSTQIKVIEYLDSINTKSPNGSSNIRRNLILAGIDFIKSEPIFGIGPGGFASKLKYQKQKYYSGTQKSPHNFPIEIISQYGLFGWAYFISVLLIFTRLIKLRNKINSKEKVALLLLFLSMPLLWMMPSAFLYLNIHCLFLPLILIQLNMIAEKTTIE